MSVLVSLHQCSKSFSARPLFDGLTFAVESGDRIGLIGPNGAGKSTLLRILAGKDSVDDGTVSLQRGLRVGYLEQTPTFTEGASVLSTILEGAQDPDDWEAHVAAQELISKLALDEGPCKPETPIAKLSGGWKKRVALARELIRQPDLLLLDEPTNHLDVESILWLEEFLSASEFATITITHDRAFLQKVSNRILELDRRNAGGLLNIKGDYAAYLEVKGLMMSAQERREIVLKNTLRRETEWLRRGAKARTTKQQARINRAGELKDTVSELTQRNQVRTAKLDFQSAERNPKKLIEAKRIAKSYGDRKIFKTMDLLITPGTRVGLLGANGCGKSTLIRVLLGHEASDVGEVLRSEHLRVAYFEQNRESLDPKITVAKTLCPSGEYVDYRGSRIHIRGYLDRFLFTQGQMDMAVGKLSGGEQSRLLIAKLMLQECNVLVLDEPTNDLDMATLNVLEECLTEFTGAVVLVTHDRYFMDQVATRILAFGAHGEVIPVADLDQWETWFLENRKAIEAAARTPAGKATASAATPAGEKKRKLSYKDQRELDSMEGVIAEKESKLEKLTAESTQKEYASNAVKLAELGSQMQDLQSEIDRLYARWAELSE